MSGYAAGCRWSRDASVNPPPRRESSTGPVSAGLREACRESTDARRVTTDGGRYKSLLSRAVSSSSGRVTSLLPLTIMTRPGTSGAVKQPEVGSSGARRETIRNTR